MPRRSLRDVDSAAQAFRIKALTWSLIGLVIGAGLGTIAARSLRAPPLLVIAGFAVGLFCLTFVGSIWFGDRMGSVAASLYFSSGRSTRSRREHSLADSLLVRGRVADAIAELERAAAQYPDDPEPCLRLARVLRDRSDNPEAAVRQFRAAISRMSDPGREVGAMREIIEIYTHRLNTPQRALPDLARLSHRFPGTPAGEWARRELLDLKRRVSTDD